MLSAAAVIGALWINTEVDVYIHIQKHTHAKVTITAFPKFYLGMLKSKRHAKFTHIHDVKTRLTLVVLNQDTPFFCKQCRYRSVGF